MLRAIQFNPTHRFLARQLFYPIALFSLLAFGFYVGRVYLSQSARHLFLLWNLFLAWVPYLCSLWVALLRVRGAKHGWSYLVPMSLWLIFFPNATYLITDLYNLRVIPPIPLWYDIGLFVTCAWTGCLLAVVSLHTMQSLVKNLFGRAASWIFLITVIGLNGIGIYLGRFLRWNSWDLFLHPYRVLADIAALILHPFSHPQPIGVMLMFSSFLFVFYLTFVAIQHRGKA